MLFEEKREIKFRVIKMIKYFAVRCTGCGKYSGTEIENIKKKVFHCKYCNKRFKLKKVNEFGITTKVSGPYSCTELPKIVRNFNELTR